MARKQASARTSSPDGTDGSESLESFGASTWGYVYDEHAGEIAVRI